MRKSKAQPSYYVDRGCSVAPACLDCPLPRCRYDVAGGARALAPEDRDPLIRAARAAGEPVDAIASRWGLSRRTVFRITGEHELENVS